MLCGLRSLHATRLTPGTISSFCWTTPAIRLPVAGGHLEQKSFRAAGLRLQVAHRIRRYQLSLVDDDDLLAGLLHFGQDVRAEEDGVVAGQALDKIAGFIDLLGVEARRRFIENQHVRVVNDWLVPALPAGGSPWRVFPGACSGRRR